MVYRSLMAALLFGMPSLARVPPQDPVTSISLIPLLEGTTWAGDGVVAPTVYTFEKGGVLRYSYKKSSYRNGTWKQTGEKVYWETNKKYCEFKGTVSGDDMHGRAWNVRGGKWKLHMKRRFGNK